MKNEIVDLKMEISRLKYNTDTDRLKNQIKNQDLTLRNEIKNLKRELDEKKTVKERFLEGKVI